MSKGGAKARFLFESATWARVVQRSVVLTEVFRQADARFVNLLNEMRRGQLSDANVALLRSHMAACLLADRQRAGAAGSEGGGGGGAGGGGASIADRLKLFPHNQPADAENARRLAQLGGTARMSTGGHVALPAGCHTSPPRPAQRARGSTTGRGWLSTLHAHRRAAGLAPYGKDAKDAPAGPGQTSPGCLPSSTPP